MLDTQMVSVSLAQGIDTKTDPKQVTSQYILIQNAIYQTLEQLNLRSGFSALSNATYSGGSITAGLGIASLNQSLLEHDGISSYSRISDLTEWTTAGQKQAISVTSTGIGSFSSPWFCSVGMARASNGIEVYVWIDRNGSIAGTSFAGFSYYSVFDTVNNVTITSSVLATNHTGIRVDVIGSNFFITATTGAVINVYKQPITAPNFKFNAPVQIASGLSGVLDIDTAVSTSALYILGDKLYRVDATTLAITSVTPTGLSIPPSASISYDLINNRVWIGYLNGGSSQIAVYSSTLTLVITGAPIGFSGGPGPWAIYANNNIGYLLTPSSTMTAQELTIATLAAGPTLTFVNTFMQSNSQVISKPIVLADGNIYWAGAFVSNNTSASTPTLTTAYNPTQPTTFLYKVITSTVVNNGIAKPIVIAKALALETGLPYSVSGTLASNSLIFYSPNSLIVVDANNLSLPNLKTTQDVAGTFPSLVTPSAVVVKSQFQFGTKFRRGVLANNIHTSGGYISSYDENIEVEHGWHLYPEMISAAQTSQTPGVQAGTYLYTAIYRWSDAQGQIHRSAPATPLTVVVASNNTKVTLSISTISVTDRSNYYVDIYRTANAGTIYYFVTSVLVDGFGATLNGTFTDVSAANQPSIIQLYTTGGEVENISAPATNYMVDYKNRLFAISSENPYSIWYSKQILTNFPVEFAQEFVINLEARGGPASAVAPLDDKLIIFKQSAIFYMVGDGPAPSGANNDFSYPQTIPSDSGVTEPDSVIGFPDGVLFKGSKGIYLLSRSLTVEYIGAAVEAYNQYTITSAVVDYNLQLIRYTLSNGISLVFDYFVKKWSIFSNISAIDSVIGNGVYYYLQSNGVVNQETPGTYSDNGSPISMSFTTGWLSFAHIQGFQRIKKLLLLGNNNTPSSLSVSFAYDFDPTTLQTTTISNPAQMDPWQYRIYPMRQKCESMQLSITVTPTTVGKALSLSGIALEVGVKRGTQRIPSTRSVG